MAIDFEKFYKLLNRMRVSIPEPDEANPARMHEIGTLLARVSNNRVTLDTTARKLDRMLGSTKNDIEIYIEKVRIARAEATHDHEALAGCSNKEQRQAMIDLLTRNESAHLALLKAKKGQLEHARAAVESMIQTLKATKETLNSLKSIMISDMENLQ